MTTTTKRPRRTRGEPTSAIVANLKSEIEPGRFSITCGCHLVGQFDAAVPLAEVLEHLVRWADDPSYLPSLGWPIISDAYRWEWSPNEDIAVWTACRLVALVSLGADRQVSMRLFGRS